MSHNSYSKYAENISEKLVKYELTDVTNIFQIFQHTYIPPY